MNCNNAAGAFTSNGNSFGLLANDVRVRADPESLKTDTTAPRLPGTFRNVMRITSLRDFLVLGNPGSKKKLILGALTVRVLN